MEIGEHKSAFALILLRGSLFSWPPENNPLLTVTAVKVSAALHDLFPA